MSGHSKWATTHRKKELIDAKRGKIFTKLAKMVTIAARDGKSGDPNSNPSLRMAIENAKAASMPKDNIERAIKKGTGEGGGAMIEEVLYEAYAPNGIAMIIECLTDNKNRTLGEIRAVLNKMSGTMASAGSVTFQFRRVGQIIVDETKNTLKGEELELVVIDSGAEDFENEDKAFFITTEMKDLLTVRKNLEEAGVVIESSEFAYVPTTQVEVPEEKKASIESLIEKLEDLDDVSAVYSNLSL